MRLKIKVTFSAPTKIRINTEGLALKINDEMQRHWTSMFKSGRQPDGTPLPRNKKGLPLGVGGGSLIDGWRARPIKRSKNSTTASSVPRRRGKLGLVRVLMMRRGVRFQGFDGPSGVRWAQVAAKHMANAMRSALAHRKR